MAEFDELPSVEAGCAMPTGSAIVYGGRNARTAAEISSAALVQRIFVYYRKHHPESELGRC